jgi:hypothetical protein
VVDLIAASLGLIAFYLFKFFSMWPAFADYFKGLFSGTTDEEEEGYSPLDALGEALKDFDVNQFFIDKVPKTIPDFGRFVLDNLLFGAINWVSFVLGLFGNPKPFNIINWVKSLLLGEGTNGNAGSSAVVSVPFTSPSGVPQSPTGGSSPLIGPGAGGYSPNELDTFAYISNAIANGIIGGNSSIGSGAGGGGTFNFYGLTTDEVVDRIQSVVRIDQSRATRF